MKELISEALHNAQKSTPPAQDYNLHSKAACDMLASKVVEKLEARPAPPRIYVKVEVNGSTLEDIRAFKTKPVDLGDIGTDDEWKMGFKVFEIGLED